MSLIVKKITADSSERYRMSGKALLANNRTHEQKEEVFDFSTIDGGVVNHKSGSIAISSGSGIYIGDYFVGVSDSYQSISNLPFVRY